MEITILASAISFVALVVGREVKQEIKEIVHDATIYCKVQLFVKVVVFISMLIVNLFCFLTTEQAFFFVLFLSM